MALDDADQLGIQRDITVERQLVGQNRTQFHKSRIPFPAEDPAVAAESRKTGGPGQIFEKLLRTGGKIGAEKGRHLISEANSAALVAALLAEQKRRKTSGNSLLTFPQLLTAGWRSA